MKIEPGDLCVIVAESPGMECNIGAIITVEEYSEYANGWTYRDASRPLLIQCLHTGRLEWDHTISAEVFWITIKPRHLCPIKGLSVPDHVVEETLA